MRMILAAETKVIQMKVIRALLMACGILSAQGPQTQGASSATIADGSTPIYRVTVTARTAKAINYQHRSGATKVDFRGTELMSNAPGEAKVESKQGYMEIEVEPTAREQTRRRIPDICPVGDNPRGPHGEPGRNLAEWNEEQAKRNFRATGVWPGCNGRALFLRHAAERFHRHGQRGTC